MLVERSRQKPSRRYLEHGEHGIWYWDFSVYEARRDSCGRNTATSEEQVGQMSTEAIVSVF